ncbi:MAG: DUF3857 domain-containing protein [Planctomycetales bacterium]|nr:DUF3857 domain-containing protein [Planctomycetales bacterium]
MTSLDDAIGIVVAAALPDAAGAGFNILHPCLTLLVVLGIIKCGSVAKREEANTLCLVSLMLALGGMAAAFLAASFGVDSPAPVRAIGGLVFILAEVAAPIVALIGLIDYSKRREMYIQGRGQAATALVISLGWMLLAGYLVSRAIGERQQLAELGVESQGGQPVRDQGGQGALRRFPSLNYQVRLPRRGWVELDAASVSEDVSFACRSYTPECLFLVIAEPLGVEAHVTVDALVELTQGRLRSKFTSASFESQRTAVVAGIDGVSFTAKCRSSQLQLVYNFWVGVNNGYVYQLIASGEIALHSRIDGIAREMQDCFSLIDPLRVAHTDGFQPVGRFESTASGFRADLTRGEWYQWQDAGDRFIGAELAALRHSDEDALIVVPLQLPHDGSAELEDVARALLTSIGCNPEAQLDNLKSTSGRYGNESLQFEVPVPCGATDSDGYHRVVRQGNMAYLISAWTSQRSRAAREDLKRVVDSVEFFEPSSRPKELVVDQALILNQLGLLFYRRGEYSNAAVYFSDAALFAPDDATIVSNHIAALAKAGHMEDALAAAKKAQRRLPKDREILATLAPLLADGGETDEAVEAYQQLFALGHDDQDALMSYIMLLLDDELVDEAISAVAEFRRRHDSTDVRSWHGHLLTRKGDYPAAVEFWREFAKERPRDRDVATSLADALDLAEDYSAALEVLEQLEQRGTLDDEALVVRGRAQLGLKWYRQARDSFDAAAKLNPRSDEIKQYQQLAANLLGQGDTASVRTPIEPVSFPESVQQLVASAVARPPADDDADVVEFYRIVGYEYRPRESRKCTVSRRFHVLTRDGVDQSSTMTVRFDPSYERVYVNTAEVRDETGAVVATCDLDDCFIQDDSGDELATTEQALVLPIPRLQPGMTVEFVYTRDELGRPEEFGFETEALVAVNPTAALAVFVTGDVDALRYSQSSPAPATKTANAWVWTVAEPPVFRLEADQPPLEEFVPFIEICDAGKDWQTLGREYLEEIEEKLAESSAVQDKALELASDLPTRREKIAAVAQFVQDEVKYHGLEFGVRARIPNPAEKTLRTRYGDCKDHAVLLKKMLEAVDVPAHLALVNYSQRLQADVPSLDQFNHMIVWVPAETPGAAGEFLDCTAKSTDPRFAAAAVNEDRSALVLDPAGAAVTPLPPPPQQEAVMRLTRAVRVVRRSADSLSADAEVSEEVEFSPLLSAGMRSYLREYRASDRAEALSELLGVSGSMRISAATVTGLKDVAEPIRIKLDYRVRSAFHAAAQGERLTGALPAVWESWYFDVTGVNERVTPFKLNRPVMMHSTVEVSAGPDLRIVRFPEAPTAMADNRFLRWRRHINETGRIDDHLGRIAGEFPAEDYVDYCDETQRVLAALRTPLVLESVAP